MSREPAAPLYAIGFSLGGSVLLKWLGEAGGDGAGIRAAASISAPYDLAAASRYLERRVGRFYTAHFMRRLRAKALDLVERFPRETAHLEAQRIRAARTFRELDDCVTAPLFGFADATDYYAQASAMDALPRITVPTLCLSSEDDPLFPAEAVARARDAARGNAAVTFVVTPWGGHTGFVSGPWPWRPYYWAEEASLAWLQRHHAARG
jgi:uncharacterized protein